MVFEIKEYDSAQELAECLDNEIGDAKSNLGEYLRKLDDIRNLAERSKNCLLYTSPSPRDRG